MDFLFRSLTRFSLVQGNDLELLIENAGTSMLSAPSGVKPESTQVHKCCDNFNWTSGLSKVP